MDIGFIKANSARFSNFDFSKKMGFMFS